MARSFAVLVSVLLLAWPAVAAAPSPDAIALLLEAVKVDAAFHGRQAGRDELSPGVLAALAEVPRHEFVPVAAAGLAWENRPAALGNGRTLPPPYFSALMAEMLDIGPGERVLEIGTGSGYQAAILARLAGRVRTVEPVGALARQASARLARLGFPGVEVRHGEGLAGWPEEAPFDGIVVTLAVAEIPPALLAQLAPGGTMLVPLTHGGSTPYLTLVHKNEKGKLKPKPRPLVALAVEALPPFAE